MYFICTFAAHSLYLRMFDLLTPVACEGHRGLFYLSGYFL